MNKDLEKIQELSDELYSLQDKLRRNIEFIIKDLFKEKVDCEILNGGNTISIRNTWSKHQIIFNVDENETKYSFNTHNKGDLLYDFVYKLAFK